MLVYNVYQRVRSKFCHLRPTRTGHEGWMVGSAKVMGPQVIQVVIRGPFWDLLFTRGKPKVNKGYSRSILKDLEGKHDQTWNSMTFFPTFLWLKNRWCFHGFPMIFTIFADVRVRSGACLAAKETKQRHHAGVFRQKVDILWYVFFSRYVFDISWYVKLDRTNIWKNTENVDIAKLEEFWSTWLVETGACDVSLFLWGPDGTRNLLCWSIDLFLFCFCFVFLTC